MTGSVVSPTIVGIDLKSKVVAICNHFVVDYYIFLCKGIVFFHLLLCQHIGHCHTHQKIKLDNFPTSTFKIIQKLFLRPD